MKSAAQIDPKVRAEQEERARSVRENLERTMHHPPARGDAAAVSLKVQRENPVTQACAALEEQIAQTAGAVDDARARLNAATSPDDLQVRKSTLEFGELKLRALISERIAKEGERLAEALTEARDANATDNPIPELSERRGKLQAELDGVLHEIEAAQSIAQRAFSAMHRAQVALDTWRSPRGPHEQAQRAEQEGELRRRLESLGHSSFR